MAREKKTVVVGRLLHALMVKVGTQRTRLEYGRIFEELRVPLYELAMAMARDDDELLEEVMDALEEAEGEI